MHHTLFFIYSDIGCPLPTSACSQPASRSCSMPKKEKEKKAEEKVYDNRTAYDVSTHRLYISRPAAVLFPPQVLLTESYFTSLSTRTIAINSDWPIRDKSMPTYNRKRRNNGPIMLQCNNPVFKVGTSIIDYCRYKT